MIFFVFLGLIFLSYGEFAFFEFNCTRLRAAVDNGALRLSPLYYDRGQQVDHRGRPHSESIIFNRGRSDAMWTFTVGYFMPPNDRRQLNGHPPSLNYNKNTNSGDYMGFTAVSGQ